MPNCEFMCLSCGHTFEIYASAREIEEGFEVECPVCGSADTTRTYDEDTEVDEEELEREEDAGEDEDDVNLNLDDE